MIGSAVCILLLGLSVSAEAQQTKKIHRIGLLVAGSSSSTATPVEGFQQALHDLGYVEGQNIIIEYRYAEGRQEQLPRLAAELVSLKSDIIVTTASVLDVHIQRLKVERSNDFDKAFFAIHAEHSGAVFVFPSAMFTSERKRIVDLAAKHGLPSIYPQKEYVDAGGLMSYAANFTDQFHHVAIYVDKILKGAKPGDLPVEQPTKFEFIINLKTAKQIGLTIPPNVLARADRVIR